MLLEFFQITIIGQKLTSYFKKRDGDRKKRVKFIGKLGEI